MPGILRLLLFPAGVSCGRNLNIGTRMRSVFSHLTRDCIRSIELMIAFLRDAIFQWNMAGPLTVGRRLVPSYLDTTSCLSRQISDRTFPIPQAALRYPCKSQFGFRCYKPQAEASLIVQESINGHCCADLVAQSAKSCQNNRVELSR